MNRLLKSVAGLLVLANVGIRTAWAEEIPLPDDYVQLEWIRSTSGGQVADSVSEGFCNYLERMSVL